MELLIAMKEYQGEKAAQAVARHLELPAFNVYLRMSADDQKDVEKLKTELKKQYEVGKINREEAQSLLNLRIRKDSETIKDYAFEIKRLAGLAYPTFSTANVDIITKDFFIKGLHAEMQLQIKSLEKILTATTDALIEEAVRLELAGVRPMSKGSYPNYGIH